MPITSAIPKPLLPIAGIPLIVRIVEKLRTEGGIEGILVCVNSDFTDQFEYHLAPEVNDYLTLLEHPNPLGTAGELLHAKPLLEKEFLVYYGDIWSDMPIHTFLSWWEGHPVKAAEAVENPLGAMAVAQRLQIDKGIPAVDGSHITAIREKPELEIPNLCGISIFKKAILKYARMGEDLNAQTIPRALAEGEKVLAYPFKQGYTDAGSIHAFKELQARFRK